MVTVLLVLCVVRIGGIKADIDDTEYEAGVRKAFNRLAKLLGRQQADTLGLRGYGEQGAVQQKPEIQYDVQDLNDFSNDETGGVSLSFGKARHRPNLRFSQAVLMDLKSLLQNGRQGARLGR